MTARIPVRPNREGRYFVDRHQALPVGGYTGWFERVLGHQAITVCLGCDFLHDDGVRAACRANASRLIYTGPIDRYFAGTAEAAGLGALEYRSIRFELQAVPACPGHAQPNTVVNQPGGGVRHTRTVEYKHFLGQQSSWSVLVREYPSDEGPAFYPVPSPRNQELYMAFRRLAEHETAEHGVHFVGRLANYKYYNMDEALAASLRLFGELGVQ